MIRMRDHRIRIIGGDWRGRRLTVTDSPGLRPTPDRVRETLFNWLMPVIAGARCLDAFAGTGILGLEALSRGAASCVFLERDRHLARDVAASLDRFGATGGNVRCEDALHFLRQPPATRFDIVFLDPPFAAGLWEPALASLPSHLAQEHRVYLEYPASEPPLPAGWSALREKRAGEVGYCLARRTPATEDR